MKLFISHNSIDLTQKMDNFTSPVKELDLADGKILIGYFKPIRNIYIEMTSRTGDEILSFNCYKNGSFTSVSGLEDKTFGATESGLISWAESSEEKTTIEGREAYWYELDLSATAVLSINGINLVLSNDEDFSFVPDISGHLGQGSTSFIAFHQEARNQIIQRIRNSGMKIRDYDSLDAKEVDQFDLLDIDSFKQASKYLALNLIFEDLSKSEDDQYATKAERYFEKYEMSLNDRMISIDTNNNGIKDESENLTPTFIRIKRE